tara:strand:- start:678 stop:1073 length:396 start_codon:yes stop_codon:yes gene_type:complete
MAHYALLDDNNVVIGVITGRDETDTENLSEQDADWEAAYTRVTGYTAKRTSYNTIFNTHKLGGTPFRGNFAGVGYTYDEENDVFLLPKPYPSWTLDSNYRWQPPVAYPTDGKAYEWAEGSGSWVEIAYPEE